MKKLLMMCVLMVMTSGLVGASEPGWLVSQHVMLAKFQSQRKEAVAGIEKAQTTITKAQSLIEKASALQNEAAKSAAQRALETGMKTKLRYESSLNQIDRTIAYLQDRLKEERTLSERYETMISKMRGKVHARLLGRERVLNPDEPLSLREGEEIRTFERSSAQLECMDGAGSVQMGENSRVIIQEKNDETEALRLQEGKVYTRLRQGEAFLAEITDELRTDITELKAYLKHRLKKKMEVRTPVAVCAVRGTAFSVEVDAQGMTRISMEEGAVTLYDLKGNKIGDIKGGEAMMIAPDGSHFISHHEKIERWWEE